MVTYLHLHFFVKLHNHTLAALKKIKINFAFKLLFYLYKMFDRWIRGHPFCMWGISFLFLDSCSAYHLSASRSRTLETSLFRSMYSTITSCPLKHFFQKKKKLRYNFLRPLSPYMRLGDIWHDPFPSKRFT